MKDYKRAKGLIEERYSEDLETAVRNRIHRLHALEDIREMSNEIRREEKAKDK